MDRFDLRVEVPAVSYSDLDLPPAGDSSAQVRRESPRRGLCKTGVLHRSTTMRTNADAEGSVLQDIAPMCTEGKDLLLRGADKFGLSARGYHRTLRVARTIADLNGANDIRPPHIAEALSFRMSHEV